MAHEIAHDALAMIEYGDEPTVLLLADSEAGLERGRRAAALAGCRVCDAIGVEGAVDRLDRQVAVDAVLAEIESDHGTALDRLLDRLDAAAAHGRHRSVIAAPAELIDLVAARAWHGDIVQLCGADDEDRLAALRWATRRAPARLEDIRKTPARLQQLSEEVGRIASVLASLSEDQAVRHAPDSEGAEAGAVEAGMVRAMIRARRLRDQYFHAGLFADPAWDMLLDLMAARLEGQKVAVSSLCIAAAVPATTALRWIKTLTGYGLFVRTADPDDGRRVYIELSDEAARGLEAYLKAAQRLSPLAI